MKTFNLFSCKHLRQRERHLLTMQIVFSCDLSSFHMLFVTWIQCNIHFWFTIIVSPNIFIQPIRRTFNKNTHIYESNAIEIDERENIKYIFIYIFFSLEISQRNENWFLTESYTSLGATIAPSLSFIVVSTDINSAMDNLARTSQQFLAIGNTAGTVLTAGIIS